MSIRNTKWFDTSPSSRRSLVFSCLLLCLLVNACSSKKTGTVKAGLTFVTNKYFSYQTPDGRTGSTNQVAVVILDDGKEVKALPYANYKTADGAFHSELVKEGQRVELEPPLGNTELWRMVGILGK